MSFSFQITEVGGKAQNVMYMFMYTTMDMYLFSITGVLATKTFLSV